VENTLEHLEAGGGTCGGGGNVVKVTEVLAHETKWIYNSLGLLVSVTDSLGQVTTNTYDTAFRLTKVTDDIGKETHYTYDAYGRQSAVGAGTSGTVDVTTYAYDATTGLLDSVEYGSSTYTASYTYDGEARLVQLTDWIDGVDGLRYDYDDVGRLVEITDYDDSTLTYTYDDAGNVLTMEDYHGNTTTYTYNDIGQLATLTAPGSKVWSYTYDTGNGLSRVDIPNGMHTEYAYDTSGRQDAILHKDGTTVVQGFEYTFEDGGNITRIDHEDGSYWEYDYDGRERLVEAVRGNHATPTIEATYAYTYDDGDNMLTRVTPWFDDFQDGNITGWTGSTGYFSVSDGVLKNTLDTTIRDLYLSETDADQDLRFDYVRYSTTGRADIYLRTVDGNNQLYLELNPGDIKLRQKDSGTLTTLATYTTTIAEDAWYQLRAVLDGTSVKIYWGAQGGSFDEIIATTTTETTTVRAAYIRAQANSEHGFDNIQLIADGRSTTQTFTYNDANEQLTSTVNGVTTDMTYDEWGRMTERDDGTHTATYGYRYGGKLYGVASDFPGEGNEIQETGGDNLLHAYDDGDTIATVKHGKEGVVSQSNASGGLWMKHIEGVADIFWSTSSTPEYYYNFQDITGAVCGYANDASEWVTATTYLDSPQVSKMPNWAIGTPNAGSGNSNSRMKGASFQIVGSGKCLPTSIPTCQQDCKAKGLAYLGCVYVHVCGLGKDFCLCYGKGKCPPKPFPKPPVVHTEHSHGGMQPHLHYYTVHQGPPPNCAISQKKHTIPWKI
jgi:YD repeat-containing protein